MLRIRLFAYVMCGLLSSILVGRAESAQVQDRRHERTQPPGFEDLLERRQASLSLFVDGQIVGDVPVELLPGTIRFIDPEQLISLLPPLRQPELVAAALQQPLPSNAGLACSSRPRKGCGQLVPDLVGVILSRDTNRLDLFLAQSARSPPRQFLPDPPDGSPTMAGALDLQYSAARDGVSFTLRQRGVAGFGRTHLVLDTVFSDALSELDRFYVRRVGNRMSLTAGLFPASHYSFIFLDRFLGMSFASTTDTRIDRATISDTPLIIDMPLSGRVEIYREGVLLDTQQFSPGRIEIDTSRFPGGVYPVMLKIIDSSGERTEDRLFARTPGLPAIGETQYFLEAGANVPFQSEGGSFFPELLSPALRAGVDHRIGAQFGAIGRVEASQKRRLIEVGGTYLQRNWRATATVGLTDSGEQAAALTFSGSVADISWSLDARGVHGTNELFTDPEDGLGRSYRQVTALASWNRQRISIHTGVVWRNDTLGGSAWSVLPRLLWTFAQRPGGMWQLDASGSASRSAWAARIGLRRSLYGGRSNVNLYGGGEIRRQEGNTRFEPIFRSDWHRPVNLGPDTLGLRASLIRDFDNSSGRLGADLTTSQFQATADAILEKDFDASTLFGRASTQFGWSEGRLAFGSGSFTGAGVIADVESAPKETRFAVRTGWTSSRPFGPGRRIFASAQPFTATNIGINALAGSASLDTRNEPAVFFPGTVKLLTRKSTRTIVIFGQLVDAAGAPIASTTVKSESSTAETDRDGNLQMDIESPVLVVETEGGGRCTVDLSGEDLGAPFKDIGVVTCN